MQENEKKHVCCICGKEMDYIGNNPWPIKEDGECCDDCNFSVVIPERVRQFQLQRRGK